MRTFPFPDKIESREELKSDILFNKIPSKDMTHICDIAWERGENAANQILDQYPDKGIRQIAAEEKLKIKLIDKDNVVGNVRYFSEYFSGKKEIVLYSKSVELWAKANSLNVIQAEDLILSHELYHHLECTQLGLTSNLYTVPIIKIGKFSFGKNGIRALSEIGAHGFSKTYYDNRNIKVKSSDTLLVNCAVNAELSQNREHMNLIYRDNKLLKLFSGKK